MPPIETNLDCFTEDEHIVAEILLDLHNLFTPPGPCRVSKRTRHSILPETAEPNSSLRRPTSESDGGETKMIKHRAKSPVTPLSSPPSETHDTADAVPCAKPPRNRKHTNKTFDKLEESLAELPKAEQEKRKSLIVKLKSPAEEEKSKPMIVKFKLPSEMIKKRQELEGSVVGVKGSIPSPSRSRSRSIDLSLMKTETAGTSTTHPSSVPTQRSIHLLHTTQPTETSDDCSRNSLVGIVSRTTNTVVPHADQTLLPSFEAVTNNKKAVFAWARKMRKEKMMTRIRLNRIKKKPTIVAQSHF